MRVLHLSPGKLYGGVETLLVTLALRRAECPEMEPEFALAFRGRIHEELMRCGVPVYDLGEATVRNPLSVLRSRRNLTNLLKEKRFDVAICHMPWTHAIYGRVVRAAGLPLVFWLHNEVNRRNWVERWASFLEPDLTICNSNYTATTLRDLFPRSRYEVIYYPVSPSDPADPAGLREQVRKELGTPREAVVIVQASRMEPWKGHRLQIEALERLRNLPGWFCWQIGGVQRPQEQSYYANLQEAAKLSGLGNRYLFLGQRSDVNRLLRAADIHCQPNQKPEPFGIAFIEALAAGLPVLTTAMGAALEIVDESCGILVKPNGSAELADALRSLIVDEGKRKRLSQGGPKRARDLCDPRDRIRELRGTLSTLLN